MMLSSARSAPSAGAKANMTSARRLAASRAVAARTTFRFIEAFLYHKAHRADRRHHHLCNAVAAPDLDNLFAQIDEDHFDLTPVVGIDRARRIEHGDAVFCCQTRSGTNLRLV